jgi:TRAP-type C4-dicarboxylate transport system substrate-binding protein
MKKLLTVLVLFAAASLVFAGGNQAPGGGSKKAVNLSLNHVGASSNFYHEGSLKFAELVKNATNGAITIDVFPASQIASGAKAIEFVQMGTLDIALESTMALENFVSEAGALNLPFMFKTKQDAFRILDGDIGKEIEKTAEAKGFKILAWWDNGFRAISNSVRPVINADQQDMETIKAAGVQIDTFADVAKWIAAVQPVYVKFPQFDSLRQKIQAAQQ